MPRVTFDVHHLFVVVCGCDPHDKPSHSLAIFAVCQGVIGGLWSCLKLWACPLVA